jgi:hypothetical protein
MQKIIKIDSKVIVMFEDGSYYERNDVSKEEFETIVKAESDEEVFAIMCPEHSDVVQEYLDVKGIFDRIEKSNLLTLEGEVVYWKEVSELSMPTELVKAVLDAEEQGDEVRVDTYRNFWTLMGLNPDEKCRKNLFWFLERNGLIISRCGFFVAYRNVVPTKDVDVYTDAHSGTTRIEIGKVVTMPREKCDSDSDVTCSRGLHLGARTWLKQNYFGSQGLVCLCNPADVVAVPKLDYYGKLRTCAYLPIEKAQFDHNGDVIAFEAHDGFDCGYVTQVIYEGLMGTETDSPYKIVIPEVPGINKEVISDKLLDIAKKCITDRQI